MALLEPFDFVFRPLRSIVGLAEHELTKHTPIEETEERILDAVTAIHRATDSIEHHVEVIEGLATSVGPLTDSVDRLTTTMADLVSLLAPMAAAQHGVKRFERLFGGHRSAKTPDPPPDQPSPDAALPAAGARSPGSGDAPPQA